MLKQVLKRHMLKLQSGMFNTRKDSAIEAVNWALSEIGKVYDDGDRAMAMSALLICVNTIAEEVIEFIDDEV